jgi:serine protease
LPRALSTLLVLVALLAASTVPTAAREPGPDPVALEGEVIPGEVIVSFRGGRTETARVNGLTRVESLSGAEEVADPSAPVLMSTGGRPVGEVLAELRADASVQAAEPNYVVHLADSGTVTAVEVDDPRTGDQYSLDRMRVRSAWNRSDGGSNLIAVLDTGVWANHPDLRGRVVMGRDFVNDDRNAGDDNGHGTWVAGIIAANANDGYGIAGISWTDRILPVKIMNREGRGSTADLLAAIRWSADRGADVINMSVGGFPYSQLMQDAVNYAFRKGAVLVGAAGNNRREETYYPASFDNVISVSATQRDDEFSNWSSYGPRVDVSAPGSSVLTTNCSVCTYADHDSWGSHTFISGTSFATPNVSGVVALIRAKYPAKTPSEVVKRLFWTVDDLGQRGWDKRYGRGRVNAYRALGGYAARPAIPRGDSLERNNVITRNAPRLKLGATARPTIYPAGDVDVFSIPVPRAGRLDVRVSGVVDSPAYPWNRSGLPIDPIVELYTGAGAFIKRVDNQWEGGTELAQLSVRGWSRVIVRVRNWYPNGSRNPYAITPTFVDTVDPVATVTNPPPSALGVSRFVDPVVEFSERVVNATSSTLVLRDATTEQAVPATVKLDANGRRAKIVTHGRLEPLRRYRVEVRAGITDVSGNPLSPVNRGFETGTASFMDTRGTPFETEIEWLFGSQITEGCTATRFCPADDVQRGEMASFLARALGLPAGGADRFTDDEASPHEDNINRVAAAGITQGCRSTTFCPMRTVSRGQMASFLARAMALPAAGHDFFSDDDGTNHEDNINRIAAAGITLGCGERTFCPNGAVSRQEMAAFLYRALSD